MSDYANINLLGAKSHISMVTVTFSSPAWFASEDETLRCVGCSNFMNASVHPESRLSISIERGAIITGFYVITTGEAKKIDEMSGVRACDLNGITYCLDVMSAEQ